MTKQTTQFSCQCSRCNGTGKYDRGTCFGCKGLGYKNQATKPRGLTEFNLTVTYANGSKNNIRIFASRHENAVSIITRICQIKGWEVKEIV